MRPANWRGFVRSKPRATTARDSRGIVAQQEWAARFRTRLRSIGAMQHPFIRSHPRPASRINCKSSQTGAEAETGGKVRGRTAARRASPLPHRVGGATDRFRLGLCIGLLLLSCALIAPLDATGPTWPASRPPFFARCPTLGVSPVSSARNDWPPPRRSARLRLRKERTSGSSHGSFVWRPAVLSWSAGNSCSATRPCFAP